MKQQIRDPSLAEADRLEEKFGKQVREVWQSSELRSDHRVRSKAVGRLTYSRNIATSALPMLITGYRSNPASASSVRRTHRFVDRVKTASESELFLPGLDHN